MTAGKKLTITLVALVCLLLSAAGCGLTGPAAKPETGPAGKGSDSKPNPPLAERFISPPARLYDLEAIAGTIFEGLNKENWPQAENGLYDLQAAWQESKQAVGDKKGVKEADEALPKLAGSILDKKADQAYGNLNKFMGAVSDIGKSYKLSPLPDIISVGNALRSVSFYAEENDWRKASSKMKGLEDTWNSAKPSMEQFGILGSVTAAHSSVKQLKDAVNAESKDGVGEKVTSLNESLGRIRDYYRGK